MSHRPGSRPVKTGAVEDDRQEHGDEERRREVDRQLPAGLREQRRRAAARLPVHRPPGDDERDHGLRHPDREPRLRRPLLRRDERREDGRHADGDLPPAGHGGESRGALHRLADEAQVVHRAVVQRGRLFGDGVLFERVDDCHAAAKIRRGGAFVKCFTVQSKRRNRGFTPPRRFASMALAASAPPRSHGPVPSVRPARAPPEGAIVTAPALAGGRI